MNKIDILNERRKDLFDRVNEAEKLKKEVVDKVQKIAAKYSIGELSFYDYHESLKKIFGERTPQEWINYYDSYIEKCRKEIERCNREILNNRGKKIIITVLPALILIFLSILYFNGKEEIQFSPSEFADNVNFTANESKIFNWTPENPGNLESLKISGRILGNGSAKIYLDTHLVLNSENLANKNERQEAPERDVLTGFAVFEGEKVFSNYCEETCNTQDFGLNKSGYELRIEIEGNAQANIEEIIYFLEEESEVKIEPGEEIVKIESRTERGKEVVIKRKEGIENVRVNTEIPESWNIKDASKIRVLWLEENKEQDFEAGDINGDGFLDEISWNVISLDEDQTFIIIVITKAEHLDSDKNFVSDIYDEVKEKDDVWSETINDGEYVRVTFERNLTNENDITIFPRIVSGNPKIEIYEENENVIIAEFINLEENEYNKVFLESLEGEQDTFDLKITGGSVEFEHIIDPYGFPGGVGENINLRIQSCLKQNGELNNDTFPAACSGVYPNLCSESGDRLSCDDATNESAQSLRLGGAARYGGVMGNFSNTTFANCNSITRVELCYKFWGAASQHTCYVGVDANGGTTWSDTSVTCSGTEQSQISCLDVTSLENWQCSSFFGASGIKAAAKAQARKNSGTGSTTWYFDTLYFNITYSIPTAPYTRLNFPANGSKFLVGSSNISLNTTVFDNDVGDLIDVFIYGINSQNTADFYKHGLLYQRFGATNNSNLIYAWNASLIYPDSSTVVLYHLDNNTNYGENQALANDFGSINLDIVAVGNANPNMTGGKFAGGWVFDGDGDYLSDTGDVGALNGIDNATISAWIKRAGASSTGFETIVQEAGNGGYYLTASCNDNIIQFGLRVGTSNFETTFSNSIIDSNWHQIAGVYDGDADLVYLYFDGVLKNSSSASTDVANSPRGIRVGGHAGGAGHGSPCNGVSTVAGSFNGTIDEVGVWNRSLTASEILNLYQVSGKYYWKVNLTDGTDLNNESETREFFIMGLPVITNVNATNITLNSAVINWSTDVLSNSSVNYGLSENLGTLLNNSGFVFNHSINLQELSPNTLYYYNVTSCDEFGFCSTNGTFNFTTLSAANSNPIIAFVNFSNQGAVPEGVASVLINFSVTDADGVSDLNDSSARAEIFNSTFGVNRFNSTCSQTGNINGNTRGYLCEVGMWYFDPYGNYIVNVTIADNSNARTENSSNLFTYFRTISFSISSGINFGSVTPGQTNISGIESLRINNTGNADLENLNITAFNLTGASDLSYYIPAQNFWSGANQDQCSPPASNLDDNISVSISSFSGISTGNLSAGQGQGEVFFCLAQVPDPLLNQAYSTQTGFPWEIIFSLALVARAYGKRRKINIDKEELLELLGDKLEEILEIVNKNKLIKEKEIEELKIPLSIFKEDMGAAEALSKYLKENVGLKISEIAQVLNRDRRTISLNYKNAAQSKKDKIISADKEEKFAEIEIFSDRRLSVLESAVYYLREKEKLRNMEIADILGKDQRNIWTLYSRAVKKLRENVK